MDTAVPGDNSIVIADIGQQFSQSLIKVEEDYIYGAYAGGVSEKSTQELSPEIKKEGCNKGSAVNLREVGLSKRMNEYSGAKGQHSCSVRSSLIEGN